MGELPPTTTTDLVAVVDVDVTASGQTDDRIVVVDRTPERIDLGRVLDAALDVDLVLGAR